MGCLWNPSDSFVNIRLQERCLYLGLGGTTSTKNSILIILIVLANKNVAFAYFVTICKLHWLWRWSWLPHRLSKRQSLSTTTVLFRTTLTRTIILNLLIKWILGSNLSQKTKDCAPSEPRSLRKHPFLLALRHWGCFAKRPQRRRAWPPKEAFLGELVFHPCLWGRWKTSSPKNACVGGYEERGETDVFAG